MKENQELLAGEEVDAYEEAVGVSFLDTLTGLGNHGIFRVILERELQRALRYGNCFTLAFVAIDSFKNVNRAHGHIVGDRVIREVANCIKKEIRLSDSAARYSGHMFAILLAETTSADAIQAARRIRKSVEELDGPDVTVSIGMADCPRDATDCTLLIERARRALHQAKKKGENCVVFQGAPIEATQILEPRVLVVDDMAQNLKLMHAMLVPLKYHVITADSGEKALEIIDSTDVDLILLDVMMPGMDGYETCRRIKTNPRHRLIPVILITALDDMDSKIKGIDAGADDFLVKPPNKAELSARTKSLISLKKINENLADIENVLFSLAKAVEAKDAYTQGHIERVSSLSMVLGQRLGLGKREIEALKYGGILHDIGKIGVPNDVLNKPGPLDPNERALMETHSSMGYSIGLPLKKNLGAALDIIRYHHEKLDGSGYPDGLKGEEIPVVAKIVAVADIYDALKTDRPYRKGMAQEKAIDILLAEARAGKLDKQIVMELIAYCKTPFEAEPGVVE